jgi:subtilisin family serine protease
LSTNYPDHHVTGNGPNAYLQLSGTSMAAGVVSGAVALLLEESSGRLTPKETRLALQVTSTFLGDAGVLGAGTGSVNALAAVELLGSHTQTLPITTIGEEANLPSGFITLDDALLTADQDILVWGNAKILVWGNAKILVWGSSKILVWGSDILVWGSSDILVWGNNTTLVTGDILVWGNVNVSG